MNALVLFCVVCVLTSVNVVVGALDNSLIGNWAMVKTGVDSLVELFTTDVDLLISAYEGGYKIKQRYGSPPGSIVWMNFTLPATIGDCHEDQPEGTVVFAENGFEGLRYAPGAKLTACNSGATAVGALGVTVTGDIHASTGLSKMTRELRFLPIAGKLDVTEERSSRQGVQSWKYARMHSPSHTTTIPPPKKKAPTIPTPVKSEKDAKDSDPALRGKKYSMTFDNDWNFISGTGAEKILMISLQAMANMKTPQLYFDYGPDWDFTYCAAILEFYQDRRGMEFTQLNSTADALAALAVPDIVSNYVVYDPDVRESLMVAMTIAGIEKAIIVAPTLVSMLPTGFNMVYDLRDEFTGSTPTEIYLWAYDKFYDKTSRDTLIWMGGQCGDSIQPGVMDYGIRQNAFFTDLNTRPQDDPQGNPGEYNLAKVIVSGQNKYSMVQGWHSYCKDLERTFVTLASTYSLRVEGLNTIPNLSFNSLVPVTPGFQFKNNHNDVNGKYPSPEKGKVYISCVQTDALGLGAWVRAIYYSMDRQCTYGAVPCILHVLYIRALINSERTGRSIHTHPGLECIQKFQCCTAV